jgi:hypothetical protein
MIKDHGKWYRYQPGEGGGISGAPPSTLYARRESDGVDWYDYVHPDNKFLPETLKLALFWNTDYNSFVVVVPTYTATEIFPDDRTVMELDLPPVSNPIDVYANKLFDPATGAFTDPPPPELPPQIAMLEKIMKRLDKLEKRK